MISGVPMIDAVSQMMRKRRQWFGSCGATPGATAGSDDIDETVHEAERLHRAAVAVDEAGAAGHEALPAVAALLARPEAELDRVVLLGGRFAGAFFAEGLGFFVDAGERYEDAEFRDGE